MEPARHRVCPHPRRPRCAFGPLVPETKNLTPATWSASNLHTQGLKFPHTSIPSSKGHIMSTNAPVTPERIMQFAWGPTPPLILEAAIRHGVFDVLDSGPK